MIVLMWAPFNALSGLPSETVFTYLSETSSALQGFLYPFDPLRIHTTTFYHLSYLLARAVGMDGSYVPFQVVYASLWWARGFLVFLLVREWIPEDPFVPYVCGSLVVVHSADRATQWVGQLNQFGFIFWMLLACYGLVRAVNATAWRRMIPLTTMACFCEYMSLWSYESQIFLLLAFPCLAVVRRVRSWRRAAFGLVAWYSILLVYLWFSVDRYVAGGGYQETVIRKTWALNVFLSDWLFNILASIEFWTWSTGEWRISQFVAVSLATVTVGVFVLGGAILARFTRRDEVSCTDVIGTRTWSMLLLVGFAALALSFPAYLLLDSARSLWRTQFLSGIGSSLVLTGVIGLVATRVTHKTSAMTTLALAAVIVMCGSLAAIQIGGYQRFLWERHRASIVRILRAAPSVTPDTVVILINVQRDSDPFGHNMWLDLAVRLAYPGIPVTAGYYYKDGSPGPGHNLKIEDGRWKWDGTNYPPLVRDTTTANTIVVDDDVAAESPLVKSLPAVLCPATCAVQPYDPEKVITGPISPRARRRYQISCRSLPKRTAMIGALVLAAPSPQ